MTKPADRTLVLGDLWSRDTRSLPSRAGSILVHLAVVGLICLPLWHPVQVQVQQLAAAPFVLSPPQIRPPEVAMRHLAGGSAAGLPQRARVAPQPLRQRRPVHPGNRAD